MADASPDLARAWHRAVAGVRPELSGPAFDLWIGDVSPLGCRNGVVQVAVPNPLVQELMVRRWAGSLRRALSEAVGEPLELEFQVATPAPNQTAPPPRAPEALLVDEDTPRDADFASPPLNGRFTFESFVIGPSNRFPQAAAEAVAKNPGGNYNPLFLYGGVGLGKTHLMQAIGHKVAERHPELKVVYVSGETFLYHFVSAIREDRTGEFRRRYRSVDVWLVDDFQFIASRERTRTEAEFFHTFNALYETNKQIVVTSDRPPKELLIDDRLRSRFECGLVTDIKPPDVETRLAILQNRCSEDRLRVPDEVLMYVAQVARESIRVLEGALVKLVASASLMQAEVTLDLARECLKDYSLGDRHLDISTDSIQQAVTRHYGLDGGAITSKSRRAEVALARQVAMYLSREIVKCSFAEIGEQFGRDHSTVIHACTKIADLLAAGDPDVSAAVSSITERIRLAETS
ncbi:MAG: chromosomal replication initiator protein DnaA [Fimbriimonadaceae bacterium]|nr:chromosomal replication initiator protein DnaA [Fimbriimonadaceae bacterium]